MKERFITAVSRMSAKSNAFRFVDYDPTQTDVQVLSELVTGLNSDCIAPQLSAGAPSAQLDSNVLQSSASAGASPIPRHGPGDQRQPGGSSVVLD